MNADTTAALITASGQFTDDLFDQVKDLRTRLGDVESRERRRDRLLVRHHAWDIELVNQARSQGLEVAAPPPLWIEDGDP